MYYISKELSVSGAHKLTLPYESKCRELHGHNWRVKVFLKSETLNENGMILDYTEIKKYVMVFDHKCINDLVEFNPTAENICKYYCDKIPHCYRVEVWETDNSWACYEI
ncbi:MAG: 6-carboxytetrahydropterin synthase [Bacteriovoracaceae bacterium]|nr:6-carboxytetrahydropterin synthase [Bacteriovoracaceae bacterium]